MIYRLPRWVWVGAWLLAFIAGIINAVGLLGFGHQAVTHLTGTTSQLAEAVANLDGSAVLHFAAILGSFLVGTVLSGCIVGNSTLKMGRHYGLAMFLESLLLFLSVPLLEHDHVLGVYCASCACGLQNAMISTFSGATVRTTHLSGMFTDLGIFLGHAIVGLPIEIIRLWLCLLIISAFFCGGVVGAVAYGTMGYSTLYIPATLTGATALAYVLYRGLRSAS